MSGPQPPATPGRVDESRDDRPTSMRVLVLDSDYVRFLGAFYRANPGLQEESYARQLHERRLSLFGTAPSYAAAFRELGHEAAEVFMNNGPMQSMWANEHALH